MSAVLIEADAEGWYESGPVRDVMIRNNEFIDCALPGRPGQCGYRHSPFQQSRRCEAAGAFQYPH